MHKAFKKSPNLNTQLKLNKKRRSNLNQEKKPIQNTKKSSRKRKNCM